MGQLKSIQALELEQVLPASDAVVPHAPDLTPDLADDRRGSGPHYAEVIDAWNVRYRSDEFNHQLIIETPGGELRFIGGAGAGSGEFRYPRGIAVLPSATPDAGRLYVCDAWNHRIQILDLDGCPRGAFGSVGAGDGQFDVPSDVALVRPRFPGEEIDEPSSEGLLLAIADRWNGRVQIFEPDGTFVAAFGARQPQAAVSERHAGFTREGWPFFRLGEPPSIFFPTRLAWRAPYLDVTCANGRIVRVDLALALLPDFEQWRRDVSIGELQATRRFFRRSRTLPPPLMAQIDTDLGAGLLARGRATATTRLWQARWPSRLDGDAIEQQLNERVTALSSGARPAAAQPVRLDGVFGVLDAKLTRERRARGTEAAGEFLKWRRQISHRGDARRLQATDARFRFDQANQRLSRILDIEERLLSLTERSLPQGAIVWAAPTGEGRLQHVARSGETIAVVSGDGRALWLFDRGGAPLGRVVLPTTLAPLGVAALPQGGWVVSDEAADRVLRVFPDGRVDPVSEAARAQLRPRSPNGLTSFDGRLFVADRDRDRVQVYGIDGQALGCYPRIKAPVAVAASGGTLWISELGSSRLRQIALADGQPLQQIVHPELFAPAQIAVTPDGLLVVADTIARAVHAFSPSGQWLGSLRHAAGRRLGRLSGLALLGNGHAVVADQEHGYLVRFELPSTERPWRR